MSKQINGLGTVEVLKEKKILSLVKGSCEKFYICESEEWLNKSAVLSKAESIYESYVQQYYPDEEHQ